MKDIKKLGKKRFSYRDIMEPGDDYFDIGFQLENLIVEGIIRPVKKAGRVSVKPNFYNEYFVNDVSDDGMADRTEILRLAPRLLEYYISHTAHYIEDREWLLPLSRWMKETDFMQECSVKERSYEIYRNEKKLEGNDLRRIFNRCGLAYDDLSCYRTYEPFFCNHISDSGFALVLENKDPWYSITKALKEKRTNLFLNTEIMYVIYGEGRKIDSAAEDSRLQDFIFQLDPVPEIVLYGGDIDRAGISILGKCMDVNKDIVVCPFEELYEAMVEKAPENPLENEPSDDRKTKSYDLESRALFLGTKYVRTVLEHNLRIPQEILTYADYQMMCGN